MTMSVWPPHPPPHPTLFAIIPRIWTHYRTRPNTSAPDQGQVPFWFHLFYRQIADRREMETAGDYCSLLKMKDNFLHLTQPPARVTKTSYWKCIQDTFMFFAEPPNSSKSPQPKSEEKKMVEVYLLYFYIFCFVLQDVQDMSPLLSLKNTGECVLWAWKVFVLSFYFLPCILCHKSPTTYDSDFCLLLYGHLYENIPFFPMPTLLC